MLGWNFIPKLFQRLFICCDGLVDFLLCSIGLNSCINLKEGSACWYVQVVLIKCKIVCLISVPEEFNYDPVSRTYGEPQRRPEIRSATIEFIASSDYMVRLLLFQDTFDLNIDVWNLILLTNFCIDISLQTITVQVCLFQLRPPQPAVYLYVLDVSFNAVSTGKAIILPTYTWLAHWRIKVKW